jgi:hypothetical protein
MPAPIFDNSTLTDLFVDAAVYNARMNDEHPDTPIDLFSLKWREG